MRPTYLDMPKASADSTVPTMEPAAAAGHDALAIHVLEREEAVKAKFVAEAEARDAVASRIAAEAGQRAAEQGLGAETGRADRAIQLASSLSAELADTKGALAAARAEIETKDAALVDSQQKLAKAEADLAAATAEIERFTAPKETTDAADKPSRKSSSKP
jgi:chromosome segregation ATPase